MDFHGREGLKCMEQEKQSFSFDWAGRKLTVEIGQLAKQANGAVLVRYGDTAVLSTATASKEPKNLDFFPLTVNYEERLYAVGKIPGGFIKREGRPSEKAILASRSPAGPIERAAAAVSPTASFIAPCAALHIIPTTPPASTNRTSLSRM